MDEEKKKHLFGHSWFAWIAALIVLYVLSAFPVAVGLAWMIKWGLVPAVSRNYFQVVYAPVLWPLQNTGIGRAADRFINDAFWLLTP